MSRSKFTVAELQAQGMLLGMWYDVDDHTFNNLSGGDSDLLPAQIVDADDFEAAYNVWTDTDKQQDRFELVRTGQIGACDYEQYKEQLLGYAREHGRRLVEHSKQGADDEE